MTTSPYSGLQGAAFWGSCRDHPDFRFDALYQPKITLPAGTRIATAGSCFAQNLSRYLCGSALEFVDAEPAPAGMRRKIARRFGYHQFSARYGNVYTTRQLRQLLEDTLSETCHDCAIWQRDGRYFDALRPGVEPEGFETREEVVQCRLDHLRRVRQMLRGVDVFVFTLGLTECWEDRATGLVFPTVPGLLAGRFDPEAHGFLNLGFRETLTDLEAAIGLMRQIAPDLKVILTVSPVPLAATATGRHVLQANTYSKSVLRAVAGEFSEREAHVDYFPSYEIITALPGCPDLFKPNQRDVTEEGVGLVMSAFFEAHGLGAPDIVAPVEMPAPPRDAGAEEDPFCEEALLEVFGP